MQLNTLALVSFMVILFLNQIVIILEKKAGEKDINNIQNNKRQTTDR